MDLPQPKQGQRPNIEVLWAGDARSGHLSVSIRIGTFFGVSNAFADSVARSVIDCEALCECDIHADTGDLMASFHVEPEDWQDFAHAIFGKVVRHVAGAPHEWNKRNAMPAESHMVGDTFVVAQSRRVN